MSRDEELNWLEKEIRGTEQPHIAQPDVRSDDTGEVCWLSQDRFCGPDCVAYDPDDTDSKCIVLKTGIGVLKALEGLIPVRDLVKGSKRASVDPLSAAHQQPPPNPRGSR